MEGDSQIITVSTQFTLAPGETYKRAFKSSKERDWADIVGVNISDVTSLPNLPSDSGSDGVDAGVGVNIGSIPIVLQEVDELSSN